MLAIVLLLRTQVVLHLYSATLRLLTWAIGGLPHGCEKATATQAEFPCQMNNDYSGKGHIPIWKPVTGNRNGPSRVCP